MTVEEPDPPEEPPREDSEDSADSPEAEEPRRLPRTIGGMFYIVVLLTAAVAVGVVIDHHWRLGVKLLAASLAAAALLRLVLPQQDAGMLAVRHRLIDVLVLVGVAGALFYLAGDIPNQPM